MPASFGIDPVQLLADLIRQPSVTPELHGAFDVLEAALVPLGFTCERVRFDGDGSYPVDNLFATRGEGGTTSVCPANSRCLPLTPRVANRLSTG